MSVLLDLQQIAVVEMLRQQCLGAGEYFLYPLGDGLGAVMAEATYAQSGRTVGAQVAEVISQAA
ncbi:hypothetical protein D9M73_167990 [compost metagenome]